MSTPAAAEGSCLCGAVTIKVARIAPYFTACHCGMCRKWAGGPLLAINCGQDVHIEGADSVAVFDSSEWAERGFCRRCGTHLFFRLKGTQEYHLPVGVFEDSVMPVFGVQVFMDRKPDNYTFADETKEMTEAQVFAMYAPKS